jgi:hypothetical protein
VCFDFLYNRCLKHFSFSEELRQMWWKMYIILHVKYPLFLSSFNGIWIFMTDFRKIPKATNFMKIWLVGDVDRQTWLDEANSHFLQFCKHPLKVISMILCLDFLTCGFLFLDDMLACHSRTDVLSQDHRQRPNSCPVIILSGWLLLALIACTDFACTHVCAHTTLTLSFSLSLSPLLCIGKCFRMPLWTHVYGMPVSFAVCPVVINWYDVHNCGNFGQIFPVPWYCWPATVLLILQWVCAVFKLLCTLVLHGCLEYTDMSCLSFFQIVHSLSLLTSTPSPPHILTESMVISVLLYSGKCVILIHTCDLLISVSVFTKC